MGLYKRPDSPWWYYRIEGTAIRKPTGVPHTGGSPTQDRELKAKAQGIYAKAQADYARAGVGLQKPPITFRDYAAWYREHVVSHQRGAPRARSMLKQMTRAFGDTPLTHIDAHRVREWMTSRRKAGLAPGTVNRELDLLKTLMTRAVPKYLDASPLGEVRRFRVAETERTVLTRAQEAALLDVADDEGRALLIVALDTLLRLSSLVSLRWAQVKDRVIVPLNAKVSLDAVPISTRARAALDALPIGSAYVFASLHDETDPPTSTAPKNRAIRWFQRLCQQADVKHGRHVQGVTFHCLRHTGASRALRAGASVRTVMKLGGWKDMRSVLRYLHASDADVQAAAESIGQSRLSHWAIHE